MSDSASPARRSTAPIISGSTRRRLAELAASLAARLLRLPSSIRCWTRMAGSPGDRWRSWTAESELIFLGLDGEAPLFAPLLARRARPARLGGLRSARPDGARGRRHLGRGAEPDRMAQPPSVSAATAERRRKPFEAAGAAAAPAARLEHFPRVDPVVIMLAEHDGQGAARPPAAISAAAAIRRLPASSSPANRSRKRWLASSRGSGDRASPTSATSPASPGPFPAS